MEAGDGPGPRAPLTPVVECVPNFSEGRRREVIDAILDAVRRSGPVSVLDFSCDSDHNRCFPFYLCIDGRCKSCASTSECERVQSPGHAISDLKCTPNMDTPDVRQCRATVGSVLP